MRRLDEKPEPTEPLDDQIEAGDAADEEYDPLKFVEADDEDDF